MYYGLDASWPGRTGVIMAHSFVIRLLRRMGAAASASDDESARRQGWQITQGPLGLSRIYRHPGFGELATCPTCDGSGSANDTECTRCLGTGRVRQRRVPTERGH